VADHDRKARGLSGGEHARGAENSAGLLDAELHVIRAIGFDDAYQALVVADGLVRHHGDAAFTAHARKSCEIFLARGLLE
jgi:hypothetical protein